MKVKILFILFLVSCQTKNLQNGELSFLLSFFNQSSSKDIPTIDWSYGKKISFNQTFSVNLSIQNTKNLCLISSSPTSKQMEFGPFIKVCYPDKNELLQKIIHNWQKDPKSIIQAEFSSFGIKHKIFTITQIKKQFQSQKIDFALLGDNLLERETRKLTFNQKLLYKENFGASFAIPYFSFFVLDTKILLLFPPKPPIQREKNYLLLIFDLFYKDKFRELFQTIITKNQEFSQNCKKKDPILTEIFSYSLGPKRFIELKNPTKDIICFSELAFFIENKKFQLKNPLGWLLPKSILLFAEDNFYESLPIDKNIWRLLKQGKEITLKGFATTKHKFSNRAYHFENEYFSNFLSKEKSCSNLKKIYEIPEYFCGNPGIDFEKEFCDLEDFYLSEINLYGIEYNSKVDSYQKFIEIYYQGNEVCDLSNFEILIDEIRIPIAAKNNFIEPKSVFVIGGNLYLENIKYLIKRNLNSLNLDTKIYLFDKSSKRKKKLFDNRDQLIYKNSQNEIFSLVQTSNDSLIYYPFDSSANLKPYIKNHKMGPGKKEEIMTSSLSVYFSEVNWMGAYQGTSSKPYDEFIEFFSPEETLQTVRFEMKEGDRESKSFLLPLKKNYNILSKKDFICYKTKDLQHSKFSLTGKVFDFKITNPFEKQEFVTLKVDGNKKQGLNTTSEKKRSSYIFTGYKDNWSNSSLSQISDVVVEDCRRGSFSSPKSENLFEPFFISKKEDKNQVEFDFMNSKLPTTEMKTKQYTIVPPLSKNINLPMKNTYNIKPDGDFDKQALIYLELPDYKKLFLYNQSELYLSAINTCYGCSKNRWVQICNRSKDKTYDLTQFFMQDEDYPNKKSQIISYKERKPEGLPDYIDSTKFIINKNLPPNFCGYIIKIDNTSEIFLPLEGKQLPIRIFTTSIPGSTSKSLLYRGLSSEDQIDLYQTNGTKTIHIHSYGNRHSNFPFKIRLPRGKVAYLKDGKQGKEVEDYEIR